MRRAILVATVTAGLLAATAALPAHAAPTYTLDVAGNFEAYHAGTLPAGGADLCLPGDPRCDHVHLRVEAIQGTLDVWTDITGYVPTGIPNRCVGVSTVEPQPQIAVPRATHIAVWAQSLGGVTELVATSQDGTLVFWGSPGVTYDVAIGHPLGSGAPATQYDARFASQDIDLGDATALPDDVLVCAPGLWAADTGLELVTREL